MGLGLVAMHVSTALGGMMVRPHLACVPTGIAIPRACHAWIRVLAVNFYQLQHQLRLHLRLHLDLPSQQTRPSRHANLVAKTSVLPMLSCWTTTMLEGSGNKFLDDTKRTE
ncbi:hypothetical protein BDP55DRAFT_646081 [Colletotrichum godetiae]|uniref:Uncharacterized protein n=1 Tax=Colletotrichum godetiae TaxID=1209918 RepID=A0AAJ0AVI0_9PEZI|nr:uncharacterized protein BDP55DRAFT_646081 [Colletotrichum godetiae]KAK1691146.1 hypothetical protein BDP55DRAFT_646081 [Colletotrichum godetiae]